MISKNSCLVDSYDLAQFCAYVRILYFSIFENTYCIHIYTQGNFLTCLCIELSFYVLTAGLSCLSGYNATIGVFTQRLEKNVKLAPTLGREQAHHLLLQWRSCLHSWKKVGSQDPGSFDFFQAKLGKILKVRKNTF